MNKKNSIFAFSSALLVGCVCAGVGGVGVCGGGGGGGCW